MSSAILTLLASHILTFLEGELVKQEPAIVAALEQDVKSLIAKLEALISSKSNSVAAVATPVLNVVSTMTQDAVNAAGQAVANDAQQGA